MQATAKRLVETSSFSGLYLLKVGSFFRPIKDFKPKISDDLTWISPTLQDIIAICPSWMSIRLRIHVTAKKTATDSEESTVDEPTPTDKHVIQLLDSGKMTIHTGRPKAYDFLKEELDGVTDHVAVEGETFIYFT